MKKLLLLAAILVSSHAYAGTWALVAGGDNVNNACANGSATCAVTVQSTGSGNLTVIWCKFSNTADTISSVSDGSATYGLCTASACHSSDSTNANGTDIAYALSSTSGKTSITVTKSSTNNAWVCRILQYSTTAGPAVYDVGGNRNQSTNTTSPAGVTLTLGGSNDVIIQSDLASVPTAISGSYTTPADFDGTRNYGVAGWVNTSSGSAPTWTQTNSRSSLSAVAFKESAATASNSEMTGPSKLAGPSEVK